MGCFISFPFPHLSAHFKLLHVMMVFFSVILEFLPSLFQAENQIYKSKAMGEKRGDWRAFKSFQGSLSFRGRNKQEIKMEQRMAAILLFGGLKIGAFLNASCFRFWSNGKEASSRLLFCLRSKSSLLEILKNRSLCCCMSHGCYAKESIHLLLSKVLNYFFSF